MSRQLKTVAIALSVPATASHLQEAPIVEDSYSPEDVSASRHAGDADVKRYAKTYSKYLDSRNDYEKKYTSGHGSYAKQSVGGEGVEDYQKYLTGSEMKDSEQTDYRKYADTYAPKYKQYMRNGNPDELTHAGAHGGDGRQDFQKYFKDYDQHQDMRQGKLQTQFRSAEATQLAAPADASDCNTEEELKTWLDTKTQKVSEHVAKGYLHFAVDPLQEAYRQRLAELRGEVTPASAPSSAQDCHTKAELDAWLAARKKVIADTIPKAYRQYPMDALKEAYDIGLKRIAAEAELAKVEADDVTPKTTQAPAHESPEPQARTVGTAAESRDPTTTTDSPSKAPSSSDVNESSTSTKVTSKVLMATSEDTSSFLILAVALIALPASAALGFFHLRRSRPELEAPFLNTEGSA